MAVKDATAPMTNAKLIISRIRETVCSMADIQERSKFYGKMDEAQGLTVYKHHKTKEKANLIRSRLVPARRQGTRLVTARLQPLLPGRIVTATEL